LDQLESESIHIFREVAGQFERPALLFSGGKDSIVLVHLALKAFRPGKFPFPLVHIDTGHNFQEALDFRDELANKIGEKLIVRKGSRYDQRKKPDRTKRKIRQQKCAANIYIIRYHRRV
jgi:sulfate adenylyltransferase subunit 2